MDPALAPLLARLKERFATPTVISGRDRATLETKVPGLATIGSYGLEVPETISPTGHPPGFDAEACRVALGAAAHDVADVETRWPGTRLEVKTWGLSVHFRDAAAAFATAEPRDRLEVIAERAGLRLVPGRLVLELRPPDANKGRAVDLLLEALRPSGMLFAGDDLGDVPAWQHLNQAKGIPTLSVGVKSDETPEDAFESCDLTLPGQPAVADLMQALLAL